MPRQKKENPEQKKQNVADIISRGMGIMETARELGTVKLEDTNAVKERTMLYLNDCMNNGVLPDNQSYALVLGHTPSTITAYMRSHSETDETRMYFEQVRELFSSMLSQAALNGQANNIFAIFSQKANFGWREDKHIVVEHQTPLGLPKSEKEIKQLRDKYAVDAKYEEVKDGSN